MHYFEKTHFLDYCKYLWLYFGGNLGKFKKQTCQQKPNKGTNTQMACIQLSKAKSYQPFIYHLDPFVSPTERLMFLIFIDFRFFFLASKHGSPKHRNVILSAPLSSLLPDISVCKFSFLSQTPFQHIGLCS